MRYCSKNNTSIIGGANKALSYFIKNYNPEHIISFSDNRWFSGKMYKKLNFIETPKAIKADYSYILNGKREHKFNFRKDKIQRKFDIDMSEKTERQAMKELNFLRIYDCGKRKWEWTK